MNKKSKVGRKTINDKKEMVGIYLKASEIKNFGGKDKTRIKIYNLLKIKQNYE